MPHNKAVPLCEILCEEYNALRPESGYDSRTTSDLFAKVHREPQPLSALCISGGGIRSATFALGAIQSLAELGLLTTFDYLSTVSGGGYIGSWLTGWKQRAGGLDRVVPHLRTNAPPIPPDAPDPIQHLREYNSYLSPKLGLLSTDTWTLAATVARNMLLNWLVFVPLLVAALLVPRLILSLAALGDTFETFYGSTMAQSILPALIPAASAILFALAIFNTMRYLPGVGRRQHSEIDFVKWVLAPVVLSSIAFVTNDSWFTGGDYTKVGGDLMQELVYWQVVAGVVGSGLAGWLAYLVFSGKKFRERVQLTASVTPPILFGTWLAGSVAWLLANYIYPSASWAAYITYAAPLLLLSILLAGALFVGIGSRVLSDEDREWFSRAAAWVLLFIVGWSAVCALVLLAPSWVVKFPNWLKSMLGGAGVGGGWLSALAGRSSKSDATQPENRAEQSGLLTRVAMALGAPAFVTTFAVTLVLATNYLLVSSGLGPRVDWWNHEAVLEGTRWESVFLLGVVFLSLSQVMARFININTFSLHAMYRNRLIRAYLGASNDRRSANKFTGFAQNDNLKMHELDPALKPFHVVNVNLNLVAGQRLAWQQRKAESFTISPLHCGSNDLGYRTSKCYGDGISLGTAITISGAAASPNMGYHSSAIIGFIMTLFNARLGAWLGNPGPAGDKSWQKAGPTSAVGSLVKEAFGLTNNSARWVNLSDGGHFENLGVYEMVRRRCRYIVVLDGGCDPTYTYEDLGNALRKIRIDLKIPIQFEDRTFQPLRKSESRFATARIGYTAVDDTTEDGWLLYIKPVIRGNEPPDVLSYRSDCPTFPHESTADQFFNESQTESYRALGAHTVCEICEGWNGTKGLAGLIAHLSPAETVRAISA
jgi:hypothetical protein